MTVPTITASQAQAAADQFLYKRLADPFVADSPTLDAQAGVWRVPVLYSQIFVGPIGQAGEILVSLDSEEIVSHTSLDDLRRAAHKLLKQHRRATGVADGLHNLEDGSPTTALQARAEAYLFLNNHLGDRFTTGDAILDVEAGVWRVPILLAYPIIGSVGQTGEILVSDTSDEIVSHTSLEEMKTAARALYEQHHEAIEAAFSRTRNS